jgi:hypothetical protein
MYYRNEMVLEGKVEDVFQSKKQVCLPHPRGDDGAATVERLHAG